MSFHAAELELYGDYYARLGGEGITVDVLAPFLAQSGLPRETLLGKVLFRCWALVKRSIRRTLQGC